MVLPKTLTLKQISYLQNQLDTAVPAADEGHGDGCEDADHDDGFDKIIDGTNQPDVITRGGGRDLINGFNGDDMLSSGAGAD